VFVARALLGNPLVMGEQQYLHPEDGCAHTSSSE
jgi:hypothetical protein